MWNNQPVIYIISTIRESFGIWKTALHSIHRSLKSLRLGPSRTTVKVLIDYGMDGHLLETIKPLYNSCKCCVRTDGIKPDWFGLSVELRQGCVLSLLLFIVFADKIFRKSKTPNGMEMNDVKVQSLLLADDVARLMPVLPTLVEGKMSKRNNVEK